MAAPDVSLLYCTAHQKQQAPSPWSRCHLGDSRQQLLTSLLNYWMALFNRHLPSNLVLPLSAMTATGDTYRPAPVECCSSDRSADHRRPSFSSRFRRHPSTADALFGPPSFVKQREANCKCALNTLLSHFSTSHHITNKNISYTGDSRAQVHFFFVKFANICQVALLWAPCSLQALCVQPPVHITSISRSLPLGVKSLFSPFVSKQCPRSQINLSYVSKIQPSVIPSVWDTTKHSQRAAMNYSFSSHERLSLCLSCFTLARKIHWSLPLLRQQEQTSDITQLCISHAQTNSSDRNAAAVTQCIICIRA